MDDRIEIDAARLENSQSRRSSVSTVDSEIAEQIVRQYEIMPTTSVPPVTFHQTQSNSLSPKVQNTMTFDKSDGIHVGDIINYYCTPGTNKAPDNLFLDQQIKSHSHSEATLITSANTNQNKLIAFISHRNRLLLIVISIIIVTITGGILFMMRHKLTGIEMTETTTINNNNEYTSSTMSDTDTTTSSTKTTTSEVITTSTTEYTTPTLPTVITLESFVSRKQWNAELPRATVDLNLPIYRIIIAQTATDGCDSQDKCTKFVQELQINSTELDDIPYNFLIGNDSKIYEGRGFKYEGQHTMNENATEYNSIGICVAFIGNYESSQLTESQIKVFNDFIEYFVEARIIDVNYTIFLQDQLIKSTTPGDGLAMTVQNWKGYKKLQKVYHRKEWNASDVGVLEKFGKPMNWSIVTSTGDEECFNFSSCSAMVKNLQIDALENDLDDIPFAFIIGGPGLIFEGRGWDYIGQHTDNFNEITVAVCVIGSFGLKDPSQEMLDATENILEDGASLGKLTDDFKINGRQDLNIKFSGPGGNFIRKMYLWTRYTIKRPK